MLFRKALMPS
jgi:hypothetical protein